jgi:hypothetical protein
MDRDIKYETLRAFATGNIKVLADNQKAYNRHLETTENMIIALLRVLKIDKKKLIKLMQDTDGNKKMNEEIGKELGVFKKEDVISTPTKPNKSKSKKASSSI